MSSLRIGLLCLLAMLTSCVGVIAQDETGSVTKPQTEAQPFELEYLEADVVKWEFGIRLHCSGGYALTTIVNAPVPMAWPEQEIELYEETKSNNVGKITVNKLRKNASYMAFVVPRLGNGDDAEAILRYRVKRRSTVRPKDTNQFEFAKKLSGMKTYLKPSPYIESKSKVIRKIGKEIFEDNKEQPAWDQVEAVYSWVRENIRYKFDPQPRTCLEALEKGRGDCEELSGLFIAICRSQGIPARAVWVPGHTYPEFYLEDETGKGHWFPCQIAGEAHEFGEMREDRPILQKGDRFKTPVSGQWTRYVKAGLKSKDATCAPKVEHLMQRVSDE